MNIFEYQKIYVSSFKKNEDICIGNIKVIFVNWKGLNWKTGKNFESFSMILPTDLKNLCIL
jgi:hypothetical protein